MFACFFCDLYWAKNTKIRWIQGANLSCFAFLYKKNTKKFCWHPTAKLQCDISFSTVFPGYYVSNYIRKTLKLTQHTLVGLQVCQFSSWKSGHLSIVHTYNKLGIKGQCEICYRKFTYMNIFSTCSSANLLFLGAFCSTIKGQSSINREF